jgi:hypothetical protein
MEDEKKPLSFVERMRQKAASQKNYGGDPDVKPASMDIKDCPNCGAGRAKQDGLTHCAYCGHPFLTVILTDGVYVKKEDNSKPLH